MLLDAGSSFIDARIDPLHSMCVCRPFQMQSTMVGGVGGGVKGEEVVLSPPHFTPPPHIRPGFGFHNVILCVIPAVNINIKISLTPSPVFRARRDFRFSKTTFTGR